MAKDSKRTIRNRRDRMDRNDRSENVQDMKYRGMMKIAKFLERGIQRPKSVETMFDAEDKRKRKVRKNYPKFARA